MFLPILLSDVTQCEMRAYLSKCVAVEDGVRPRDRGHDYERHVLNCLGHTTGITRPIGSLYPVSILKKTKGYANSSILKYQT